MSYTVSEILAHVDHTLLSPSATRAEILAICEDALKYRTASVCIPAYHVKAVFPKTIYFRAMAFHPEFGNPQPI